MIQTRPFGVQGLFFLIAVICFILAFVGIEFQGHSLVALGLAFFAAAGLVA